MTVNWCVLGVVWWLFDTLCLALYLVVYIVALVLRFVVLVIAGLCFGGCLLWVGIALFGYLGFGIVFVCCDAFCLCGVFYVV